MNDSMVHQIAHSLRKSMVGVKLPDDYVMPWRYRLKYWLEDHNPFTVWLRVDSFEDYQKLSYKQKTVWFFYFKNFYVTSEWHQAAEGGEGAIIDTYQKYKWPIQYFLRKTLRLEDAPHKIKRFWYEKISATLNPRQKWLTKKIPNTWSDKVWLIPELNFEMVVHFVDGEDCFSSVVYDDTTDHIKFAKGLKECYHYITATRPKLQKDYDDSFPEKPTGDFKKDYVENMKLEKLIEDTDTKWLVWIMKNRMGFWT